MGLRQNPGPGRSRSTLAIASPLDSSVTALRDREGLILLFFGQTHLYSLSMCIFKVSKLEFILSVEKLSPLVKFSPTLSVTLGP